MRNLVWLVVCVLVLGAITWLAGAMANNERITRMWVSAQVAEDGSARVTEVIDYDFGYPVEGKHGIYRDIPGLTYEVEDDDVSVTMDGHQVPYELTYGETSDRSIRIGDADRKVHGLHRYRITYPLPDVVNEKGDLAWDAVGTGWQVDLHQVEVHVASANRWFGSRCVQGKSGSTRSCRAGQSYADQPTPGHLIARFGRVESGHGVTFYGAVDGRSVSDVVKPVRPAPPAGARPDADASPNPFRTGLTVAGIALGCSLLTIVPLRLLGRDRHATVLKRPTAEGAPPDGLTPEQGGMILTERVEPHIQAAWLLGVAARRHIKVTGSGQFPTLQRTPGRAGVPDADTTAVLDDMFAGGRREFVLGVYDPFFKSAWESLAARLAEWQRTSDLWDPAAERRARLAARAGLWATLSGFLTAIVGSGLISFVNGAGWPVVAAGAVLGGTGLALRLYGWELKSRTGRGAALRAQLEAFRDWLAEAPPEAAEDTEWLEQLTAWAVALGVAERWERSIDAATTAPASGRGTRSATLSWLGPALAVSLVAAVTASADAPSPSGSGGSSSGGGSGGGGVGGGTGGGGGGSW